MITVIWFAVFSRELSFQCANCELFWSYKKWLAGDKNIGHQILANMLMFVPFGFLIAELLNSQEKYKKQCIIISIFAAVFFSGLVEICQFIFLRGLFELDDIFSNSCGAAAGAFIYRIIEIIPMDRRVISRIAHLGILLPCLWVLIKNPGNMKSDTVNDTSDFCFQIEEVLFENGGTMKINGFMFLYKRGDMSADLFLKSSETGEKVKLTIDYGTARPDVNEYFLCDYDYTNSGFTASVSDDSIDENEEYEILIKWPWRVMYSSGVFIKGSDIYYASENVFIEPDARSEDLKKILEEGTLRVWRPDHHCWVYQKGKSLYWIGDPDFYFEDDGSTYIQYQLYTTQIDNLPENRLKNNWLWDNIGGYFEEYELEGDFGAYRVMKRELPTEYSIKSIVTGYYKNGEWVWKNYFRPVYTFG